MSTSGILSAIGSGGITATTAVSGATGTTPSTADNSTKLATTAYVQNQSYVTATSAPVTSVFGRTGAVTANTGDYTLDKISAATASKTWANGNNPLAVNFAQTTNSQSGLTVGETSAATGTGDIELNVQTLSSSTAVPFQATAQGTSNGIQMSTSGVLAAIGTGGITATTAATGATGATPSSGDNTTKLATTAFVQSAIENGGANIANCHWTTYPTAGSIGVALSGTSNRATLWGVYNPFPCSSSSVIYGVGTADNTSHTYDLGLLCGNSTPGCTAGNIVVHTGSVAGTTFAPATGATSANWIGGSTVIPAGTLYIAITSSCTSSCATVNSANNNAMTFLSNTTESVTAGGTLNNGITIPSDSGTTNGTTPALVIK